MEDDEVSESDTVNDDPEVNPNLLTRQTSKLKSPFISRHVTSRTNLDSKSSPILQRNKCNRILKKTGSGKNTKKTSS